MTQRPQTFADIDQALAGLEDQAPRRGERGDGQQFFGSYQIIDEVGTGGAARVVRARHVHPSYAERIFAIKLLHRQGAADAAMSQLFRNEVYLMALLRHPNIVRTFEAGFDEERLFIAMEYISGRDLWEFLERARRSRTTVCKDVLLHICGETLRGMGFAHGLRDGDGKPLQVIHHDVNPTNIFLSFDGAVKLGDFGVAVITAVNLGPQEGLGKLGYFAPEQFRDGVVDQRADIFSYGATLYELMCGHGPFEDEDPDEILRRNSEVRFAMPRTVDPEIDAGLESIIVRALKKNPKNRYPSAQMMLAALESYLPKPVAGMRLAVASYMRTLLLPEYVQELKLREGLKGALGDAAVGNHIYLLAHDDGRRSSVREALRERGFEGADFNDVETLVAAIRDRRPDALVVDVDSNGFSPRQFNDALSRAGELLPIVAATRIVDAPRAAAAQAIGAMDLVFEPLRGERLQTALWAAIMAGMRHEVGPVGIDDAPDTPRPAGIRVVLVSRDAELAQRLVEDLPRWGYAVDVVADIAAAVCNTDEATYHAGIFDAAGGDHALAREFAEALRGCHGMGMVPVLYLAGLDEQGGLGGLTRTATRVRDESSLVVAAAISQLRADIRAGRSFVRFSAAFGVDMRYRGRLFVAYAQDISRGGLMLRCAEIPPVDSEVHLALRLPNREVSVEVPARVVRVEYPDDPRHQAGVGVAFSGFGARSEKALVQFLRELGTGS